MNVVHRILTKGEAVTGVRALIEHRLDVKTWCGPCGVDGKWYIDFEAPADIDFDFLIPDVLPPKNT